jgi:hypothetical protein
MKWSRTSKGVWTEEVSSKTHQRKTQGRTQFMGSQAEGPWERKHCINLQRSLGVTWCLRHVTKSLEASSSDPGEPALCLLLLQTCQQAAQTSIQVEAEGSYLETFWVIQFSFKVLHGNVTLRRMANQLQKPGRVWHEQLTSESLPVSVTNHGLSVHCVIN